MDDRDPIQIEVVERHTPEISAALKKLLPLLSTSAPELSDLHLKQVIQSDATTLLVARDLTNGNKIVGTLTLATFRIPSGVRAWIEDVVVDEDCRGKGVGARLSRRAIDEAQRRGARTVELTSRPSREAANRLYKRLGFEIRTTNVYRFSAATAD